MISAGLPGRQRFEPGRRFTPAASTELHGSGRLHFKRETFPHRSEALAAGGPVVAQWPVLSAPIPPRILVATPSGRRNIGDDASLSGLLALLRQTIFVDGLRVLSDDPPDTASRHEVEAVALDDLAAVEQAIIDSQVVLWGGASLPHGSAPFSPVGLLAPGTGALGVFLRVPLIARLHRKPLIGWDQGFSITGDVGFDAALSLGLAWCGTVIARDNAPSDRLRRLGYTGPIVAAPDFAFALASAPSVAPSRGRAPVIAVALDDATRSREEAHEEAIVDGFVGLAVRRGATFRLVAFSGSGPTVDDGASERVATQLRLSGITAPVLRPTDAAGALTEFSDCDVVVATHDQSLVIALLAGRPTVTLARTTEARALAGAATPPLWCLPAEGLTGASFSRSVAHALDHGPAALPALLAAVAARRSRLERLADVSNQAAEWVFPEIENSGSGSQREAPMASHAALSAEILALRDAADSQHQETAQRLHTLEFRLERSEEDKRSAEERAAASSDERDRLERAIADLRAELVRLTEKTSRFEQVGEQIRDELGKKSAECLDLRGLLRDSEGAAAESAARNRVALLEAGQWKTRAEEAQSTIDSLGADLEKWQRSRLGRLQAAWWTTRRWLGGRFRRRRHDTDFPDAPRGLPLSLASSPIDDPGERSGAESRLRAVPAGKYDVVIFPCVEWDSPFQRPRQLAVQFGRAGHRVLFVSTTGVLSPDSAPGELAGRGFNVDELKIRSRRELDIIGGRLDAGDIDVLARSFEEMAVRLSIGDAISIVQIPFWAPLAERLRETLGWKIVYDCMEDWETFPGLGSEVASREDSLVRSADVTAVSARKLEAKWKRQARNLVFVPNGIDLSHYRTWFAENRLLEDLRSPVVGCLGGGESSVDVELVETLARSRPDVTFVVDVGDRGTDLSLLAALPNIRLPGQPGIQERPQFLWHFDACLMPLAGTDWSAKAIPVEFFEYCFSGKPIVASDLAELRDLGDVGYLARYPVEFADRLDSALGEPADDPRREQRRALALASDWEVRCRSIGAAVSHAHRSVSIVVVTFGGLELTKNCLSSILTGETWPNLEVIVVDNASPDATRAHLETLALGNRRLRCVFNDSNLGFAAANNIGVRESTGEIVILLNNDTIVPPGMIGRLVAHLERNPTIGLVCPTTNFCGNEAKVEAHYETAVELSAWAARRAKEHAGELFDLPVAAMYCVGMRRSTFDRVGPLDEAFGVGLFEDDDYSLRMRREGFRVTCAEDAYVHHLGMGSFSQLPAAEYQAIWNRNRAHYEQKWGVTWRAHRGRVRPGSAPPDGG